MASIIIEKKTSWWMRINQPRFINIKRDAILLFSFMMLTMETFLTTLLTDLEKNI